MITTEDFNIIADVVSKPSTIKILTLTARDMGDLPENFTTVIRACSTTESSIVKLGLSEYDDLYDSLLNQELLDAISCVITTSNLEVFSLRLGKRKISGDLSATILPITQALETPRFLRGFQIDCMISKDRREVEDSVGLSIARILDSNHMLRKLQLFSRVSFSFDSSREIVNALVKNVTMQHFCVGTLHNNGETLVRNIRLVTEIPLTLICDHKNVMYRTHCQRNTALGHLMDIYGPQFPDPLWLGQVPTSCLSTARATRAPFSGMVDGTGLAAEICQRILYFCISSERPSRSTISEFCAEKTFEALHDQLTTPLKIRNNSEIWTANPFVRFLLRVCNRHNISKVEAQRGYPKGYLDCAHSWFTDPNIKEVPSRLLATPEASDPKGFVDEYVTLVNSPYPEIHEDFLPKKGYGYRCLIHYIRMHKLHQRPCLITIIGGMERSSEQTIVRAVRKAFPGIQIHPSYLVHQIVEDLYFPCRKYNVERVLCQMENTCVSANTIERYLERTSDKDCVDRVRFVRNPFCGRNDPVLIRIAVDRATRTFSRA